MTFTPEVYEQIREGAKRSAVVVVPMLCDLVGPERVVDVGCGEGWFAREFARRGCKVLAIDREVEERLERVEGGGSVAFIREELSVAERLAGEFDLAVCLEVAEHLPETAADALIASLTACAPVVAFSAAIPGQGGHGHLNEQWPAYWAERFAARGFFVTGALRLQIWNDDRVEPWYRQNLLLCASTSSAAAAWSIFAGAALRDSIYYPHPLVHPTVWEHHRQLRAAR